MRTASKLLEVENLNALNFGEALHNNVKATQLKNDLVRNPENAPLLAALKSEDGEIYAQAVKDLGQLAQEKFGLDLSKVDLYDGEKTTSGSLGDNPLTDVKGGTVVDANNQNAGDIFVDAGNGASKTDMAKTLGHEILESQDFQGKDSSLTGGLFGKNTDQQQESLANAFGDQFADRINQAAGGDLDSTGGADFSNNLKNSAAVKAGTQKANTVGNARVEHRQLYVAEAKAIVDNAQTYADKHDISLDQAKQELTQQALLQVDSEWADQAHIQEKERARKGLLEIAALQDGKATDSYARDPINKLLRENESKYFQTDETAYNDTTANAHEASSIENGAAGEENFLVKYATENGEKPLEVGLADAAGQVVDNAEAFLDRATKDPLGLLKDTASGILDTVVDCSTTMNCVLPDQTHGTASDRELVYELLNNNDEAKQAAAEDTLDTLAGLAGPAGRVFKEGTGVVAGEAVEQAVKKVDVPAVPKVDMADTDSEVSHSALDQDPVVQALREKDRQKLALENSSNATPIEDPSRLLEHKKDPGALVNESRGSVILDKDTFLKYYAKKDPEGNPVMDDNGSYKISDSSKIPEGKYITFEGDVDGLGNSEVKNKLTIESIDGHKGYEQYDGENVRIDFDLKKPDKQLSVPGKSDYLNDIGGPRTLGGARQRIPVEDIPLKNNNPSVTLLPEE